MEQLTTLLEQLAYELGTTIAQLWPTLLRQARLSAITDIIVSSILVIALVWCYRLVKKKTTPHKTEEGYLTRADWYEEGEFFAWLGLLVVAMVIGTYVVRVFSNIITGIINPEYWALQQVLTTLRN